MNTTKNTLVAFLFAFAFMGAGQAQASVTVTPANASISADTAANAAVPAWTTLGPISIVEGAVADFSKGTNVTLLLKAPAGWQFNTGSSPGVNWTAARDISTASIAVSDAATLTITLTVSNTTAADTLNITGVQVQPTQGTPLVTGLRLYRPTTGGGSATIAGITTDTTGASGTSFGAVTEVAGTVTQLTFTTQPAGATAGAAFGTQPAVKTQDQFGNNSVSGLASSLWITTILTAGTGPMQGTATNNIGTSSGNGTITYSGLRIDVAGNNKQLTVSTTNGYSSDVSSVFTVNNAAASKLVIATQPSSTATAGLAFAQQPVIYIEDAYNNICNTNSTVTATRNTGAGILSGTTNMAAVAGVVTYANLALPLASTITIQFTSTGLTSTNSTSVVVSPDAFSKVQLLMPGETAAAGTITGKTGTPTAQVAGTAFNVTVNAVDANWNLINTVTDTVDIGSSDANATLPADTALVAGTKTLSVTFKTAASATVTASDVTDGSKTANTSPSTTVNVGTLAKLQLLMPGETAAPGTSSGKAGTPSAETAGTAFTVTVRSVDANWNLVSSTHYISITASDPNATLPGSTYLSGGTQTFSVTFKTAGSWTVTATDGTDGTRTPNTSPSTTVNAGAFAKLQILAPGEVAAPGTSTGKTVATPTAQNIDNPFSVTVNAVDANWNLVNTASDTVAITSSDPSAALPGSAALVSGTQAFAVKFNTAGGTRTVTVTDSSDGTKTANTSAAITVNLGAFNKLQVLMPGETAAPGTTAGKTGTPTAQTAGASFNVTVRSVDASWNLISTNDTVHLASSDTSATLPANTALSSGSVTLALTFKTTASQTATASDVTAGHSFITSNTGTATTVSPAAASKLVIATQPSATATAGVIFAQQPVIFIEDTYNNIRSNDTLVVTATRGAGAGYLLGTTNKTAVAGVATYTDLAQGWATNITIQFTSGALTAATSGIVTVSSGSFSQLLVVAPGQTNAPGTANGVGGTITVQTAGTAFAVKVMAVDSEFNLLTNVTDTVGIASSDTTAVLPANAALVNGTNSFSITIKDSGSQTVTASDITDGITTGTSSAITVNGGAVTKLQLLMPGETAAPGTTTGKTGTPTDRTAGANYSVTVNAVDANWNVVSSTHTVGITTTDPNDVLPANAALVAGTMSFMVTNKTVGSWTATATDITTGLTANTSPSYTVNVGAFAKLQILVPGMVAAPGSASGYTGAATAQNTDNPFIVTVNAVDSNWNLVNTAGDTVAITSSDPNVAPPGSTALVSGTQTFAVKFNTAGGTRTVTATDSTDGSKTANTSPAITVNLGAFAKLQILLPGETAAPGTTTGQTGSPTARIAGTAFNVTVNAVDASFNLINNTNDTVHLASTDANATLAANTAMASGTVTLSVTLKTVGSWMFTASDVTHAGIGSDSSSTVAANVGSFAKLQLLVPGETAAAGTTTGKTGTPSTETAGTGYGVTVNAVDANWNLINTNDTVGITSTDTHATLPANTALVAGTQTLNLTNRTTGSWTVTASDITHTGVPANVSPLITVSAGAFAKLQLLMPGETAAAGTTTGKTGTPSAETAGTAFNVTANAVDANWNVVNTVTDTVSIDSSDANATVPADAALVAGTKTFSVTFKTLGSATVTASDTTDGTKTANTSPSTTVNAGAFAKLQLLMPGETAAPGTTTGKTGTPNAETAGTAFTVTVNGVDTNWNVVNSGDLVQVYQSSDPNAVLPGAAYLSSGRQTFSVTFKTVGSRTLTVEDNSNGGITQNTSPATTVNMGAFAKLQILVPGLIAAPGTASGYTGAVTAQNIDNPFMVTINAVDANWNLVSSVGDTAKITSSDVNAALPGNAALVSGTQTFAVKFNTTGSWTVTATDFTDGTKTNNTSPSITVNLGAFAKLQVLMPGESAAPGTTTGHTGTPTVQTAGTSFNVTVRSVDASWNLISTNDTVHLASSDAQATLPANTALSGGSVTLALTFKTTASQTATASDVTHTGIGSNTGTATTVSPAAASKLVIATQPSTTATAGVVFAQQPVIFIEDTYNNIRSNDTLVVTATRNAGAGILQGTTNVAAVAGVVTYANLAHGWATNITIQFTNGALTAATSGIVAVSPAAFSQLLVVAPGQTNAPGTTTGLGGTITAQTAGTAFAVKVMAVDNEFNLLTNVTDMVGITSSDATAVLPANAALVNGTNSFTLTIKDAGTQTVTASDITDGITTGTSSAITVNGAALAKLQLLLPGETAAPGTTTGKTGTPSAQTAGTSYAVTVRAVDANWNLVSTNDTVRLYSSDANAALPANTALTAGSVTLSLTNKTAGIWTVSASNVTHTTVSGNTSPSFMVNVGAFAKLQILVPGLSAAPGTPSGYSGVTNAQNIDTPFTVTVNAVDANWNLVNTASDTVGITSSDPHAVLPGNAALSSGTGTFSVKFNTAGSRTVTATDITDGSKTANTSPAITVNVGAFAQLQILLPGETTVPGLGKTGSPTAQTAGTAFNATVNAMDASYNIVSTNDTVHLASTDANATLAGNTAMAAGTISLSVTLKTVGSWTITASDATHALIATNISATVTANVGAFAKLQLLVPGEITAPGSASGKTGTPTIETAATGYSVTVNAVDANWNLVSTNDTVGITSSDAHAVLPANAPLVAGTRTLSLTNLTAGSWTVTASDITHTGIPANTSPSITIAAGAFTKLQLLMPGETAAAGTTTGKTGTPTAQNAGTVLNVTVNAVDGNWNLVNTVSDTVGITSTDANAGLQGSTPLSTGTKAFAMVFHTVGSQTVTATDISDGSKTPNTGSATTVNSGAVDHYAVAASSPNNAGVPFTTTVTAQDSFNNTVTTNTATVTLTATGNVQFDSNGDDVYGDNTKALTSGVLTIATKDNSAETVSITATANSKTGTLTGLVITPATGAYESVATGDWSNPANWNTYNGSAWVAATVPPASTNAPTITIQSSNTVTASANITASGLIVQSAGQITIASGQTLTIPNGTGTDLDVAGTVSVLGTLAINSAADVQIEAGGSLQDSGTVNVGGTLTASTGASIAVNTNGILQNAGTITSTASTLVFNSGGAYQHTYTTTAGTIPTATWNTNSTCAIIGYTSNTTAPSGLGQTFGNFTWNCPAQTGTIDLGGALTTVHGDLTVTSTGSSSLVLSGNLTVSGNFSQPAGTFNLTSGIFSTVTLTIGGNFSHTGGTITMSGFLSTGNIVFNKAGVQTYTSGGTVNSINFTVNSGSTLVMGSSIVTGSGTFTLSSGAGLQIGSPAGITTSGATGNVQVTGTRTYNTGANYIYNGTAAQHTGNGLPATVNSLTVNNAAGLTLDVSTTVNGTLAFTAGTIATGSNILGVGAAGTITGAGTTAYVNGTLQKAFNTGASQYFTYPIGDASNYLPFSVAGMNATTAGTLAAKTTAGDHPNIATSGIDANQSVNRYWTLTVGGSLAATDPGTFNYLTSDVDGAATPAQFVVRRYSAGAWNTATVSGTPTTTATTISGAVASGDFAIGNQAIDHYAVSAAAPQTANAAFTATVTALDALNQPVVNDNSTVVTMTSSSGTVQFDSNGDAAFGDNTKTLSAGAFTISTLDTAGETITLTATDGNAKTGTSSSIVVNKVGQTISFGTLASKNYGDAPFGVSATASSGLPVTFSLVSGPATIAGSTVTITGSGTVTIRAAQVGNATYSAATNVDQSFSVAMAGLTVTANNRSKTYGQSAAFAGTEFTTSGLLGSDTVTGVSLSSSGAAAAATVASSPYAIVARNAAGTGLANYTINYVSGSLTVNRATLTVSGITADNKPFDGTTTATIHTDAAILAGQVSGDDVTLNTAGAVGAFADATAGTGKTVYITGLTLGGTSAGNYSLIQPTTTADITGGGLTVAGIEASSKIYDGTTNATLNVTNAVLVGVASGDDVSLDTTNAVGAFVDKNVGTAKTVNITGLALFGADASKYTLTQPTTNADITAASLTVTGVTAGDKVYDGTTNATLNTAVAALSGVVSNDDVILDTTGAVGVFADATIGTNKSVTVSGMTISGVDAGNYALTQPALTASITPLPITVTADAKSKVYGDADPALSYQITSGSLVAGDALTGSLKRVAGENVSAYAIQQDTLTAGGNYNLAFVSAELTITPANSATALVSAQNPSAQGSNVTFTATVSPIKPATTTPTGNVQFLTNGIACGSPVVLSSGVASLSPSGLPVGTNTVTAAYLGDGNFNGSSNSLAQVVAAANIATPSTLGIQDNGDGTLTVTFAGTPGAKYVVQAASDLGAASWQNVSTNTAAADGQWTFTDSTVSQPVRFYRSAKP